MNRFKQLGYWVYDHRKTVLLLWIGIAIISGIFAWRLPSVLKGSGFIAEDMEASIGRNILRDRLGAPLAQLLVLIEAPEGQTLLNRQAREEIHKMSGNLQKAPHVIRVSEPSESQFSRDRKLAYLTVGLDLNEDDARAVLPDLERRIRSDLLKTTLAGDAAFYDDVNRASQNDLKKAEAIGLPITLVVLVLAFGTWIAAGLPLLVGVMSAGVTLAILYGIGQFQPLSVFVLNVPTMLGIAVGVDYALLFVSRYREELQARSVREAVAAATGTSGRAVFFSGVTVVIGISSMMFWDMMVTRSVMLGGMLVVSMTMVASLTLLPAVLGILGTSVNRGRILRGRNPNSTGWYSFARHVMQRPALNILFGVLVITAMILPVRNLTFGIPGIEGLPKTYSSRSAMETLYDHFGKEKFTPVVVTLKSKNGEMLEAQTFDRLRNYVQAIGKLSHVKKIDSVLSLNLPLQLLQHPPSEQVRQVRDRFVKGDVGQLVLTLDVPGDSAEAKQVVKMLRSSRPTDFDTWVGGAAAAEMDFNEKILEKVPHALIYTFAVTYILLFLAFQSVILPFKALLLNSLSLVAAFGVLAAAFDTISTILPVFVFAFVFGTSMDYEVFMLSRIQEEYKRLGDNSEATAKGLAVTSRLITSAALILIMLTGSFIFTDVVTVKQVGLGLAVAVLVDATLIRLLLVPSLMKLLGDWNWWAPRWTKRLKIQIE
ncbi:MMPL family transporter [Effusibacillus consociatus]|uniref:MMPL family transporter n=1 Tax=Effusibacillus consociatus TaxID=1117041 RepID=A0ABV9PXD2_9BACL